MPNTILYMYVYYIFNIYISILKSRNDCLMRCRYIFTNYPNKRHEKTVQRTRYINNIIKKTTMPTLYRLGGDKTKTKYVPDAATLYTGVFPDATNGTYDTNSQEG